MNNYQTELQHQIDVLTSEIQRVKAVINTNGFDVTTAPYVIVKRYRDELKAHVRLLRETLADITNTKGN